MELLDYKKSAKLLTKYKIALADTIEVKNKDHLTKIFAKLGSVVLKIDSKKILHKTDVGGVRLVRTKNELIKSYNELKKIKYADRIIAQKFYTGHKVIIGVKRDNQFGPVLMFGLGGIYVEIFKDIVFRIAPVTKKDALSMIKSIKSFPVLAGARGVEKADLNKLANIIVSVSNLAMDNDWIKEIDLNPVVVNKNFATVVDAKILV